MAVMQQQWRACAPALLLTHTAPGRPAISSIRMGPDFAMRKPRRTGSRAPSSPRSNNRRTRASTKSLRVATHLAMITRGKGGPVAASHICRTPGLRLTQPALHVNTGRQSLVRDLEAPAERREPDGPIEVRGKATWPRCCVFGAQETYPTHRKTRRRHWRSPSCAPPTLARPRTCAPTALGAGDGRICPPASDATWSR